MIFSLLYFLASTGFAIVAAKNLRSGGSAKEIFSKQVYLVDSKIGILN